MADAASRQFKSCCSPSLTAFALIKYYVHVWTGHVLSVSRASFQSKVNLN